MPKYKPRANGKLIARSEDRGKVRPQKIIVAVVVVIVAVVVVVVVAMLRCWTSDSPFHL